MELETISLEFASTQQRRLKPRYTAQPEVKQLNRQSGLCIQGENKRIVIAIVFILLAMTTGILIVYFTAPRPRACEPTFQRTMKSSLTFSSRPRFIASADLNNDHHMDVVVTNSLSDTIGIFISHGNGTFANQQKYSTGHDSHPYSVAINDFNNDGYADIVVANYDHNNIGLFLGWGNGTFDNQRLTSLGSSHPLFIATADFNKDNRIDVAVVNYGTNTITILLGHGNGSFQNQITYFTGYDSLPSSLSIGDFNNDTHFDIAVTNYGTNDIGIFLNHGNGTFMNQQIYPTRMNSCPSSIAVEDLNNDNIVDVVVAHYGNGSVGIFFGHGNGTFLPQVSHSISTHAHPQYVIVSDVNKDNALDIVVVDSQNDQIHFLTGYGNGSFPMIATYDGVSGSKPVAVTVNDLNNNSRTDVVVVNYNTNGIVVLMDYFTKPSARQTKYYGGVQSMLNVVAVDDFNNDGLFDVVFNPGSYIAVLMGLKNGTFGNRRTYLTGDGSNPQYICTADLNNDKQIDIIIADRGLHGIAIFLGYGNGSFGNVTTYSTGVSADPWWVALGDLNDDNAIDMVSANYGTNSISIIVGHGNGSFTLIGNYSIQEPLSVAIGDMNNDNRLDLAVCNQPGYAVIFLGQGDGTFIFMAMYATSSGFTSFIISLGHFNTDDYLDIVVGHDEIDSISVLLGNGNGTFLPRTSYFTGAGSSIVGVAITDYNNDNISDIVTSLWDGDEVVIFYGFGNGSFELARRFSTGFASQPFGIVAVDLDNDTKLELVVALFGLGEIAVLSEYNAAEFVNKIVYSTGSAPQPTSVAISDFNNDNQLDIVVANSGTHSLDILLTANSGTFDTKMTYPIGSDSSPEYVITCDVNQDNQIDIVSVNSKMNSISVIMGYGNGSFAEQIIYSTGNNSSPSGVAAGDINNDGRLDLVIANRGTDSIGVLFGYNYTYFQSQQTYSSIDNLTPRMVVVADFNHDHISDIAAVFSATDTWCILFGYGNGSFANPKIYSLPNGSSPYAIGADDFNNDNHLDIVIANYGSNNIGVLLGYGNGEFSSIRLYSTGDGSIPRCVTFGDFNNDSQSDIVVANSGTDNIVVFLGHGNGSFSTGVAYQNGQGSSPYAVAVADLNNDGRLDIAVAHYGTYSVGVRLGYGNGTFGTQVTFSAGFPSNLMWITVADFNGDDQVDIATANFNTQDVGILLGYGNGSFAAVVAYSTGVGSAPRCICVGDFNNDNVLDIAVTNSGTNSIVVLFGIGDGSFLLGRACPTGFGSLPLMLATDDFNKDGRLDIVVANAQSSSIGIFLGHDGQPFGSITLFSIGGGSQPRSVALGDFNNDSWTDVVVVNYDTDNIGILFGRRRGGFQDMQLYSTGNNSAPYFVTVGDLNNDSYLDIIVPNSETDNVITFLGDGTGKFISGQTYSTGVRSLPYTVIISDFNKDNISDIAVANSGTNNILILHGYGDGTFGDHISYPFGYDYRPHSLAAFPGADGWTDIAIACYGTDHIETLTKIC